MSVNRLNIHSLLDDKVREAQSWLPQKVLADMYVLTPIDTGRMVTTPVVEQEGTAIRYTVPYALYQYNGINWHNGQPLHYQSPTAVDHWFEKAKEIHLKEWVDGVADILTRES